MKKKVFGLISFVLTAISLMTSAVASPRDEAEPGEVYNIIYYEEFDYENTSGNDAVAKLLGWKLLSLNDKTAITNNTASYSIKDGRLYVNNNRSGASDSYIMVCTDTRMAGGWMYDYTVQFDVTLTSAGNNSRYIALLTDYKESTKGDYHSFHLRINGSANNQARIGGTWITFDAPGDFYAADADDSDGTSTIAKKILGKDYDGNQILKNIDLTIRIVNEKYNAGPYVYVRNNTDGGDFVLVSRAEPGTTGVWQTTGGKAVVLKAGGAVDGYVDNIVIYKGTGEPVWEEIKAPETTAEPETTEAPETSAPVTEPAPETSAEEPGSGCAAAIGASGIVIIAIAAAVLKKRR